MKKFLLFCTAILITTQIFAQKNTISLNQAISIALQNNTNLVKAENQLSGAEKKIKNSYGNLLPNFGVRTGWNWSKTTDVGGQQVDFLGNVVDIPESEIDTRNLSLSAGGSWVLFDGLANYNRVSQSKTDYKSEKLNLNKLKQDIVQETMSLFYDVLNAAEQLKVREENVKFNKKLLETIVERNKLGAVAKADVYTQQVQLGNAELSLIKAENDLEYAKVVLLNYLAIDDVLSDYEFTDPRGESMDKDYNYLLGEYDDVSAMVDAALNNRLDYQSQKLAVKSADYSLQISKSGYLPTISGNYGISSSSLKIDELFNRKQYSAGLTLNIPIFSNFNTEYSVQLSKIFKKNTEEDLTAMERLIKVQIKQGFQDVTAAKKALDVSKENVKAAEERRKINYERYNLGSGTILDVLQADRDFTQASSDNIDVEFSFYRAVDKMRNYLGELDYKKFE